MSHILEYSYVLLSGLLLGSLLTFGGPGHAGGQEPPVTTAWEEATPGRAAEYVELTLREAIEAALDANGELAVARAEAEAAAARARQADGFLWPALGVEAGVVSSDDPVAVFGAKLRQERFTQADFDVGALNRPDPVSDWSGAGSVSWGILDPSAWAGRDAAALARQASELGLERTTEFVVFRTRILYARAGGARAAVGAAEEAVRAAEATVDRIRAGVREGSLTEADALQAEAERAAALAELARARAQAETALDDLRVHLGWSGPGVPVPAEEPDGSAEVPQDRTSVGADLSTRADVRSLDAAAGAAAAGASQAGRARLPRVEAFGRASTHARELGADPTANLTAGIRLSWPLFTGFTRSAAMDEARARERAARIRYEQGLLQAEAEAAGALSGLEAAAAGLEAARTGAAAAEEARRLMVLRFEQGMTTPSEMLEADARAASFRARLVGARVALEIARARLDFVLGVDPYVEGL